ncbi:MAG: Smr/MutS family protein [Pseudomonadota bacterium]
MSRAGKRGRLSADDLSLWRKVTDRTDKLDLNALFTPEIDAPMSRPDVLRKSHAVILDKPKSTPAKARHHLMPSVSDQVNNAPVQMDKRAFTQMKRGKLRPEGKIDLHGMTLNRAHPALSRFVMAAHRDGKRLVLVITGKGKSKDDGGPIPVRYGVLRHQVPQWLAMPPLSSVVLQVSQAHLSHGGSGAYYVYLRRLR